MSDSAAFIPPTSEELEAVNKLRVDIEAHTTTSPYKFSDVSLLRFYRGRKLDYDKALEALKNHLKWREDNEVDTLDKFSEKYNVELEKKKVLIYGKDHGGHPVLHIFARRHNGSDREIDNIKYLIIYLLEKIMKEVNQENEKIVICFDLDGFGYSCMDNEVVKLLINILQHNYPETLYKAFIVNSPFLFSACWAVIRPWLDPVTTAKVNFVYKTDLIKHFPQETIDFLNE